MYTITDTNSIHSIDQMLKGLNLYLSAEYLTNSMIMTILVGLLCVACFVLAVIFIKKARVLGGIVAGLQFVGIYAAYQSVVAYSSVDFRNFYAIGTGSSYEEASQNAMNQLLDTYMEAAPSMAMSYVWSFLLLGASIMTIIYTTKLMKFKGKILAVFALIFSIVRIILPSVNLFGMFTTGLSMEAQASWDVFYRLVYILPAILIGVQALINIKKDKPAPAPAPEANYYDYDYNQNQF